MNLIPGKFYIRYYGNNWEIHQCVGYNVMLLLSSDKWYEATCKGKKFPNNSNNWIEISEEKIMELKAELL